MIELPLILEGKREAELRGSAFPSGAWERDRYWRSLDELRGTPAYRAAALREFPDGAGLLNEVDRRKFLGFMGASLALAGVSGCGRSTPEKIVPQVRSPEQTIPGKPLYYATAMPMPGGATGLLVESHEGRPTKIEGNPQHPASLGAAGVFEQASILGLYDPDRGKALTHMSRVTGWNDALDALGKAMAGLAGKRGAGFALLTGAINSPTLSAQIRELLRVLPQAKWYVHEPALPPFAHQAAKLAFGEAFDFVYRVDQADVILTLDADLLNSGPNHLRHAREFAKRRQPDAAMNRLYSVEAMPTTTGFAADHRLALSQGQIEAFAFALAEKLGVGVSAGVIKDESESKFLAAVTKDLQAHAGRSLVVAGPFQPPAVHVMIHAINAKLGNFGKTVVAVPPVDARPDDDADLTALAKAIDAREVDTLIILSANPVHTSPAGLDFAAKMDKVRMRIRLGMYEDETGALCHWHIPEAHFLESWSDALGPDGTASIIQPLIAPLYEGKTAHEVIEALVNLTTTKPAQSSGAASEWRPWHGREIVRNYWRKWHVEKKVSEPFEPFWRQAVHDGVVHGSTHAPLTPALNDAAVKALPSTIMASGAGFELIIRPDPTVFDGRFANNGWLQELPKPLTKIVWDNAAIVSPTTAKAIGVEPQLGPHGGSHGELITQLVELKLGNRTLRAPLYVLPGHADNMVTVHMGFGRAKTGKVADGIGVNVNILRSDETMWSASGLEVKTTGVAYTLACTQALHDMHGRDLVRAVTKTEYDSDPHCLPKHGHHANHGHNPPVEGLLHDELWTNPQTKGPYQWGMTVDLGACHGCSACVVACQAENNIAVVGKEQITRGRELFWLRIDRYFVGDEAKPQAAFQPVMCQHCENAPCEVVCPVEATTHSPDGLNEMTYNRCVGTRYCANNCPYKVRRFNFLEYTDYATESLKLQRNPDVSVRARGVMEKCTYCVQRIREAEITAKTQHRPIADGDIVTACQAACPTQAIVFGNIADPNSRVSKLKARERDYGILTELNTKPRTSYLAAVRNPNPELG